MKTNVSMLSFPVVKGICMSACALLLHTGAQAQWVSTGTPTTTPLYTNGNVGVNMTGTPHAQFQLGSSIANRKIILYEEGNNDHQFYGFGINASTLRFQLGNTGTAFRFYSATSVTASNEVFSIQGNGLVGVGTSTPNTSLHVRNGLNGSSVAASPTYL